MRHYLVVTTTERFAYDPERVAAIHAQLTPDPEMFGEQPEEALFGYLADSLYGADVFENVGDFDRGYELLSEEDDA